MIKGLCAWFFKNKPMKEDAMSALLSVYRIFAGLAILPYGWGKIKGYEAYAENFFKDPVGLGHELSLQICIFQQIGCAILLALGIQSRFAAFMLFTNMLVATKYHYFDAFVPTTSLPVVYMAMYAFLTLSGGGKLSLDNLLFKTESFAAPAFANIGYGMRVLMAFGAAAFGWIVFAYPKTLGMAGGSLLFAAAIVSFAIAVYGFCPFRCALSRFMKRGK